MITLSFHAFCMTWLFGKFAWKITRFFCNPQNCSLSMDQQKLHDIVYLKLSNENGLWIWKSKIKYEKYISSYVTFFSFFFFKSVNKPGIALESVISTKAVSSVLAISNSFSPNRFNSSMAVAKSAGDKSKEELSSQIFSWSIDHRNTYL